MQQSAFVTRIQHTARERGRRVVEGHAANAALLHGGKPQAVRHHLMVGMILTTSMN